MGGANLSNQSMKRSSMGQTSNRVFRGIQARNDRLGGGLVAHVKARATGREIARLPRCTGVGIGVPVVAQQSPVQARRHVHREVVAASRAHAELDVLRAAGGDRALAMLYDRDHAEGASGYADRRLVLLDLGGGGRVVRARLRGRGQAHVRLGIVDLTLDAIGGWAGW